MLRLTMRTVLAVLFLSASAPTFAEATPSPTQAADEAAPMTEGEIKKVDINQKKLTIKHGEIKNLGMPPMTMIFKVKDPTMLTSVKTGDKVAFVVEKLPEGFTVTSIQTKN